MDNIQSFSPVREEPMDQGYRITFIFMGGEYLRVRHYNQDLKIAKEEMESLHDSIKSAIEQKYRVYTL